MLPFMALWALLQRVIWGNEKLNMAIPIKHLLSRRLVPGLRTRSKISHICDPASHFKTLILSFISWNFIPFPLHFATLCTRTETLQAPQHCPSQKYITNSWNPLHYPTTPFSTSRVSQAVSSGSLLRGNWRSERDANRQKVTFGHKYVNILSKDLYGTWNERFTLCKLKVVTAPTWIR
jgi:hypothetical protein